MTQEKDRLINLSVHESSVPSILDVDRDKQTPEDNRNLNNSVHDYENADAPTPQPYEDANEENLGDKQITIANLSAG